MIIDEKVKAYRTGKCFAMAKALNRLLELPERCIMFGGFVHAFVMDGMDVIDIHGRHSWPEFLNFLVSENIVSADHVIDGRIKHEPLDGKENNPLWIHCGYKIPSESAIKMAICDARNHPNLEDIVNEKKNTPSASR